MPSTHAGDLIDRDADEYAPIPSSIDSPHEASSPSALPLCVLDFPQLHTKPSYPALKQILDTLALTPQSWDQHDQRADAGAPASYYQDSSIPTYITRIIGSSLTWLNNDDQREEIWELASRRLAERAGATAQGDRIREFRIPLALARSDGVEAQSTGLGKNGISNGCKEEKGGAGSERDDIVVKIHEPGITEDKLGFKTWGAAYVLAKMVVQGRMLEEWAPGMTSTGKGIRILEFGAGTGLAGIAVAATYPMATLVLSDLGAIVGNTQKNVDANRDELGLGHISVRVVDWADCQAAESSERFDVVLACDSLYEDNHPVLLADAVEAYLACVTTSRVVSVQPLRDMKRHYHALLRTAMQARSLVILGQGEVEGGEDWGGEQGSKHSIASMKIETSLSSRGVELKNNADVIDKFKAILSDPYDADKNPHGFVNLGVAENFIMLDENAEFLNKKLQLSAFDFSYGSGPWGSPRLLKAMASHLNQYFKAHKEVKDEEIHFANGVTSLCDMLGFSVCDPGDYVLLSRPIYQAFKQDLGTKAKVNCEFVAFGDTDQFTTECIANYETTILNSTSLGRRIRALILCNPHNPLGKCYTKDAIIEMMKLCNKYHIHLIVDEIYALSVYEVPDKDAVPFTSVLSLDTDQYIDPQYLHHLYGFSKDFAAGGIRLGCCYTRNKDLKKALAVLSPFAWSGNVNERMACLILENKDYLKHFLDLSRKRLSSNNVLTRKLLDKHGIGYTKGANAGFFIWVDLRPWLPAVKDGEDKWRAEDALTEKMIENKVFLTNGKELSAEEPGFYRLIFAQDPRAVEEGVKRLAKLLKG